MADYNYCCSRDGHGLSYPGFSVVFIQTFSINHNLQFCVPEEYTHNPSNMRASEAGKPMVYRDRHIEHQIFVRRGAASPIVSKYKRKLAPHIYELKNKPGSDTVPVKLFSQDDVYRFALRGFSFSLPVPAEEEGADDVVLSGHVSVEMSLFFGHTVSMTYRFLFDGRAATVTESETSDPTDATTDHIIALLSTYLGAEYWSTDKETEGQAVTQTDINLETEMRIDDFWFSDEGEPLGTHRNNLVLGGKGRTFDEICTIYKKFIYENCTALADDLDKTERRHYMKYRANHEINVRHDLHYAMVDIWENLRHVGKDGKDLFKKMPGDVGGLSEAQVVDHIHDYHKPELIGLMTLYPGEWPYRDSRSYDEVCGENIAIDTDDLVLAGSNLSVVIGTYGRRGSDAPVDDNGEIKTGVDWTEHLKERAKYHVSWPEYLMILQMVLAKKYRIGLAKDQLIQVTLDAKDSSAEELIGKNAELSMRLSRMMLQLDVVKYSKFASHIVMFDRTTKRLKLEEDMAEFHEIRQMVDSSLENLSDYKAMKADAFLNIILAIISVASTFELLFQNSEMPFLSYFGLNSGGLSAWLVTIVAAVTIFALLILMKSGLKKLYQFLKDY